MLLMVEKEIKWGISYVYPIANKEYMKNFDKNKESLYLMCLYANDLYG